MKTTVEFYMKGQPKDSRSFDTRAEAVAFMQALAISSDCESYGIVKN